MKKSILLMSHSEKITIGLKEMIEEMQTKEVVTIYSLGGTADGGLGSDPMKIIEAVDQSPKDEYFVFADIGSAIMSAEAAYDLLEPDQQERYHLVDAPLVEGGFAAAITAGVTDDIEQIIKEAKQSSRKGWEK